jgi:hypothetical protein
MASQNQYTNRRLRRAVLRARLLNPPPLIAMPEDYPSPPPPSHSRPPTFTNTQTRWSIIYRIVGPLTIEIIQLDGSILFLNLDLLSAQAAEQMRIAMDYDE